MNYGLRLSFNFPKSVLNWLWFGIFMSLVSCTESPRAVPGFQPFALAGKSVTAPSPLALPLADERRRAYEASLQGRICYYARIVDQDGQPVPNAMVLILLERLGWGTTSYFKCRTYTDAEGRFSVVGGVGTHFSYNIFKAGYTPTGRWGSLRGDAELLRATPETPATITLWKNIGIDRKKLIVFDPFKFGEIGNMDLFPPLPKQLRFDLIRGVIAKEGEDWDIALEYNLNEEGRVENPDSYITESRYIQYCHIVINQGKMAYLDDPLPEFSRPSDGFTYRNMAGVITRGLTSEKLPFLIRATTQLFQFQSRGGRVHGICEFGGCQSNQRSGLTPISLHGAINPTGSPALFEIEPTEKDLSTDGYPLSE
jgi:hypothetical protein